VFVLFVTMRAIDRIFSKRVSDRMKNYQLMYYNIMWPIGIQIMTYLLCAGYVLFMRHNGDLRYNMTFFLPYSKIACATGFFPQIKMGLFSFFDQLNASVTGLATPFIDQTTQGVFTNLVIVWTVILSFWILKTRYRPEHYIGCLLIIMSGIVSLTVQIQTGNPPLGRYKGPDGQYHSSSALWYFIYVVGTIPSGMSNVYKQYQLKGVDLEVMYATLWSGNWQILWGLVFFPLNWIPLPDIPYNGPGSTLTFLSRSLTCFIGSAPTPADQGICDVPGGAAWVWFIVYLFFNISFNVLLLWLTKRMSATWAQIATVLCLDLTSLLSMSSFLSGDEAQPVTFQQYMGLILAGIGMWSYNLHSETDKYGRSVEGVHPLNEDAGSFVADRSGLLHMSFT